jgi:phosphotriesterase-related protein
VEILTVRGPIAANSLGKTAVHEHVVIDLYPIIGRYEGTLEDEDLAADELRRYGDAGGYAIVDATNHGIGRQPEALQRISEASGVQIIMGSAWYRERVYPPVVFESTVNQLADSIALDITKGVGGTGIRAGIIGEIGTEREFISPAEERVFRASARAHKETGAAITTHTTHLGELAMEQLSLLMEEGVPANRIAIGHMGDRRHVGLELPVLAEGAFVAFDQVGWREHQSDEQRARNIVQLVQSGYKDQLLVSQDICYTSHLHWHDGRGYDYLLRNFVPMLHKAGLSEKDIDALLVDNPRRLLAF